MYGRKDYYIYNGKCYGNCPSYLRLDLEASPVVVGNVVGNVDTGNWVLGNVIGNGNVFSGNVAVVGNVFGNVSGNGNVTGYGYYSVTGDSDINILSSTIQTVS